MRLTLPVIAFFFILLVIHARPQSQQMSLSPIITLRMRPASSETFTNMRQLNRRRRRRRRVRVRRACRGPELRRFRTLSGFCNNLQFPNRGAAETAFIILSRPLRRRFEARGLPNARRISSIVHEEATPLHNGRGLSELITFFGQFLDHTVTETGTNESRPFRIRVPRGDPVFTESQFIPLFRTQKERGSPINLLSSYVDGASIYGVEEKLSMELRELTGGRMKAPGGLLPLGNSGQFLAGDRRVNENPHLQAMHLLWVLEHNKVAAEVSQAYPNFSDEEIFKLARHIVAAELQAVTFHEFLPALAGRKLRPYTGYRRTEQGRISNRFSTVAFRVGTFHTFVDDFHQLTGRDSGHTLLNRTVNTVSATGVWKKHMLRDVFFNTAVLTNEGIAGLFRGMTKGFAAEVDAGITGEVRNFLLGNAESTEQLDLAALNIQRGRDHGVPSCNDLRATIGLRRFTSFSQITGDSSVVRKLRTAYRGKIDDMDAWTCGVAEKHVAGSSLGQLFRRIIIQEFRRLRDGDRFYFERPNYFTADQKSKLATVRKLVGLNKEIGSIFRTIISRNTGIPISELKRNPFFV